MLVCDNNFEKINAVKSDILYIKYFIQYGAFNCRNNSIINKVIDHRIGRERRELGEFMIATINFDNA